MSDFFDLEWAALRAIIDDCSEIRDVLLQQLSVATVESRENTGCGFFTYIDVPETAPTVTSAPIGNIYAEIKGLSHRIGFILFFGNGRMDCLEGFSIDPTNQLDFSQVSYRLKRIILDGKSLEPLDLGSADSD